MANHRYWRIFIPETNGNTDFCVVGDIELRAVVGGTDLTNPTDAITNAFAQTQGASNQAYKAFNDVRNPQSGGGTDYWSTLQAWEAYTWLGYDFGSGNEVDINEIYFYPARDTTRQPKSLCLQYSDDNINWFTKGCIFNQTSWVLGTAKTFDFTPNSDTNYEIFRESGTFNVPDNVTAVDVLVVAGGGGGYYKGTGNLRSAGAGGAGGVIYQENFTVTPSDIISVTVGSGGVGGKKTGPIIPTNGGNSIFSSLTAIGGGAGAASANASTGGSGGGADRMATIRAAGTSGQGNAGGIGTGTSPAAGGGGGYNSVGSDTSVNRGGNGGAGLDLSTTVFSSLIQFAFVGGGGGGGSYGNETPAVGGSNVGGRGGSGRASAVQPGGDAVASTGGGGGGGGGGNNNPTYGGNGGSGLVVLRWDTSSSPSPASPSPTSPSPASPGSPSPASPLSPSPASPTSPASPSEPSPGAGEARITQVPILTVDVNSQPTRITQVAVIIPYAEYQPTRVTQIPVLPLYEPKPVPLPKVVIPEIPVNENWIWKTSISTAINGKEQRARLREYPRYRLSFNALILSESDRRDIYAMMMRFIKQSFIYPIFHYNTHITAASSVGMTELYCDTSRTDIRAGEKLALFDPYLEEIHYLDINSVESDTVNLVDALEIDVPINWQVCPAILFRTSPGNGINMNNIAGKFEIMIESVMPRQFTRPDALPSILTKDGIMIIPNRHLSEGGIPETFNMGIKWEDNDTAIPIPFLDWKQARLSGNRTYRFNRHTESDYWRGIINTLKGRQVAALFPTFRNDIDLHDTVTIGDTIISTNNIELLNYWQVPNYRYVRIETTTGVTYNKILEVLPVYDENGYPYYAKVKLQDAIIDVNIKAISFMNMCRLDNDSIDLVHYSQYSEISFSIMAIDT